MKRFAPLALVVLALAAVPAALADDGTTTGPARAGAVNARMHVEILRLRMQIVSLRFRLHCGRSGNASQERCTTFAQNVLQRLTTLDGTVQKKLDQLKACTPDSTDQACKNAEKKIAVLTRVDQHVQKAIARVQAWLAGTSTGGDSSPSSTSDSALDAAAGALGAAAGPNG